MPTRTSQIIARAAAAYCVLLPAQCSSGGGVALLRLPTKYVAGLLTKPAQSLLGRSLGRWESTREMAGSPGYLTVINMEHAEIFN